MVFARRAVGRDKERIDRELWRQGVLFVRVFGGVRRGERRGRARREKNARGQKSMWSKGQNAAQIKMFRGK